MEKTIKVGKQYRDFQIPQAAINSDRRTVQLAFSSETPVERWFGMEILDHAAQSVDLSRLKRGGALLIDHDPRNQIGVIEEVTIDESERRGKATVRFGKSAKAQEIFQDVVDGIRSNVSVGYQIDDMDLIEPAKNGKLDVYRAKWTPLEVSLVAIPADPYGSGVSGTYGRNQDDGKEITVTIPDEKRADMTPECMTQDMEPTMKPEDCTMGEECKNARCSAAQKEPRNLKQKEIRVMEEKVIPVPDGLSEETAQALAKAQSKVASMNVEEMEKARKRAIGNLCKANHLGEKYEDMWIDQGASLERVAAEIITILEERSKRNPQPASKLGLTPQETQRFSLVKAIRACASKDWKDAGLELEASRAIAEKLNISPDPNRFHVPFEVQERPVYSQRTDMSIAYNGGNYLVQTDNIGFIELLRNRSVAFTMGARRMSGLVGNVAIPRQSAAATAVWLANETSTITESEQTIVQVPLSPKNVGGYTEISRQLMMQSSPAVEGIVAADLAQVVALAADASVFNGAGGSGEPDGIIGYSGVGTSASPGTALAYAGILLFQVDVAGNNALSATCGYVTTPTVAALLMGRQRFSSTDTPLWNGSMLDATMAGFRAMSSNQCPTGDMIFGDWAQIIIGEWGSLTIDVNPYASFQAGIVGVRAIYSMDVAIRQPGAFSTAISIT